MKRYLLSRSFAAHRFVNVGPVVSGVRISDLEGKFDAREWDALIDTGADISVVPLESCQALGLNPRCSYRTAGFDGRVPARETPAYYVRVGLPGVEPVCVCALGVARRSVLLGRDFLCDVIFTMNSRRSRFALGRWSALRGVVLDLLSRL